MKKLILMITLISSLAQSQHITGKWNGLINVQGMELRLIFHITEKDAVYSTSLDSPDQKAYGFKASSTHFEDAILSIEIPKLNAKFKGKYSENSIKGTFYQASLAFPLTLSKKLIEKKTVFRPQEPKKPYHYYAEDVRFKGGDKNVQLAGTLTLPQKTGKFPVVVLISGSGPQNRDEAFMTHKPFLVLSDYLTKQGIAVLRYDDRGFAKSTGNHGKATTVDFSNDVRAAISYLKTRTEIDQKQIGLIGHSEGGLIAPMVASDTNVAFIVLLGAPGVPGDQIINKQVELISRSRGVDEKSIQREVAISIGLHKIFKQYANDKSFEIKLKDYLNNEISKINFVPKGMSQEDYVKMRITQFKKPWVKYFLTYDPSNALKKIKCPVLALNGEKDIQVTPENLLIIEKKIKQGGNNDVTIKEFPNMNHLFQTCKTGAMEEYTIIEETMSPLVLNEISNWIKNTLNE